MRALLLALTGLIVFAAVPAHAGGIDVKSLTGRIFFRGEIQTREFKDSGTVEQLYVVNANGTGQQRLLPSFVSIWDLAGCPQSKKLSFKSNSENKAQNGRFILDVREPWTAEQLPSRLSRALPEDFPVKFSGPIAFSPNGSMVAGITRELHIANVKTGAVITVKGQFVPRGDPPAWSPDGEKIVFRGCLFNDEFSNAFELFVVDKDGKNLKQITNLPRHLSWWDRLIIPSTEQPKYKELHKSYSPRWSPDSQWIVFGSFEDIYKVRPDGKDLTLIVKDAAYPTWSPDGRMIAYGAFRRPDAKPLTKEEDSRYAGALPRNIYVIGADGKGEARITNNRTILTCSDLNWIE